MTQRCRFSHVLFLSAAEAFVEAVADKAQQDQEQDGPDVVDEVDDEVADAVTEVAEAFGEGTAQSLQEGRGDRCIDLSLVDGQVERGVGDQKVIVLDLRFVGFDLVTDIGEPRFDGDQILQVFRLVIELHDFGFLRSQGRQPGFDVRIGIGDVLDFFRIG